MRRTVAGCLAVLACGPSSVAWAHWRPSIALHNTRHAVSLHFCGHSTARCQAGREAWSVVGCETGGTFSVWATNGQYLGLFQMGAYARERFGHAWDPWGQARAAARYWRASGRDWSPWTCRP